MNLTSAPPKTTMQKFLDVVEIVGNKVPQPAVLFFVLIGVVVALSHVFHLPHQVFLSAGGGGLTAISVRDRQ
jgi:p-aminobenzoyl-glutamate transporter AbgT